MSDRSRPVSHEWHSSLWDGSHNIPPASSSVSCNNPGWGRWRRTSPQSPRHLWRNQRKWAASSRPTDRSCFLSYPMVKFWWRMQDHLSSSAALSLDDWPPMGGMTWSNSFMLVRFQIFLMIPLSSSLACSKLPKNNTQKKRSICFELNYWFYCKYWLETIQQNQTHISKVL